MPRSVPQRPTGGNNAIRVRTVTNVNDFLQLRADWDAVVDACDDASIHVNSRWIEQWWQTFGRDEEVMAILLEDDNGPFGIAPLLRVRTRLGPFRIRTLRLLGNDVSARSEILFNRHMESSWQVLAHHLASLSWQFLDYGWGRANSAERQALATSDWPVSVQLRQSMDLPLVHLDASWDAWCKEKSRTFRKTLRKAEEKCADLSIRRFPHDFDDLDELFAHLAAVASDSWSYAAGTSIVSADLTRAFFEGLLRDFHTRGEASASLVMDGKTPLAFAFGLAFRDTVYGLKTSYRAGHHEKSLGTRVMADFVASCMNGRGYRMLDMDCITQHSEYKRRWANEFATVVDQRAFRRRPLSQLLSAIYARRRSQTADIASSQHSGETVNQD